MQILVIEYTNSAVVACKILLFFFKTSSAQPFTQQERSTFSCLINHIFKPSCSLRHIWGFTERHFFTFILILIEGRILCMNCNKNFFFLFYSLSLINKHFKFIFFYVFVQKYIRKKNQNEALKRFQDKKNLKLNSHF